MSTEYRFTKIAGELPLIVTEIRDGQRYIQLKCDVYCTAVHRKFEDAWREWQDHAATEFMKDLLANEENTD